MAYGAETVRAEKIYGWFAIIMKKKFITITGFGVDKDGCY